MFLVNSRLSLVCAPHIAVGPPSPEVTGATCRVPLRGFSRAPEPTQLTYLCRFAVRAAWAPAGLFSAPTVIMHAKRGSRPIRGMTTAGASPDVQHLHRSRNINRVSIAYATWPRLRSRLTLGGRTWPKNPKAYGVEDSHFHFRYSFRHPHLYAVQLSSRSTFTPPP